MEQNFVVENEDLEMDASLVGAEPLLIFAHLPF